MSRGAGGGECYSIWVWGDGDTGISGVVNGKGE